MRPLLSHVCLVPLTLCFAASLAAQTRPAVLATTITVHETGEPLADASVIVDGGAYGAITNARGQVRIDGISPGTHTIAVEAFGYRTERVTVAFSPGATVEAEIALLVAPIQLAPVIAAVRATERRLSRMGFYERTKFYSHATFLSPEEVKDAADRGARLIDVLRRVRGVRVDFVTGPAHSGYRVTSSRGFSNLRGPCAATIYLDGARYDGGTDIPLTFVSGIEVYPSPALAPPQFNTGIDCPVILVWTK